MLSANGCHSLFADTALEEVIYSFLISAYPKLQVKPAVFLLSSNVRALNADFKLQAKW
jgi:hypothetical protein